MAEQEQFTIEEAEKLLAESYPGAKTEGTTTVVPEPALTPEPVAEPAEPDKPAEGGTDKPAEPDKPAESTEDTKAPPAKDDPNDQYKWVDTLPEETKQRVLAEINKRVQVEHQERSNRGRIAAYQKQVLDAQRQLSLRQPPAKAAPTPTNLAPSEDWQAVVKSDPELAKAIEAHIKSEVGSATSAIQEQLQEFRKTAVDPLYQDRESQYVESQRQELERLVPNVHQVVASPEYADWLKTHASEGVRKMALTSVDAGDAIVVLRQYADDMVRLGKFKPAPNEAAAPPARADTTEADAIVAERERKLKAAVVIASTPLAPTPGNSKGPLNQDEAEKLFMAEYNKHIKKDLK